MKILMTTDCVGGVWTYAIQLCEALRDHGIEIALATMGPPPSQPQRRQAQQLDNVSLHVSTFALEWMNDPWAQVQRAGDWLLDLQERIPPDVIHLNGYAHASLPWRKPVLVVGHSCVLSWWQAVHRCDAPAEFDRYRSAVRDGLQAAQLVVAPSHAMLKSLERHYGSHPNAMVIANGRNPAAFKAGAKEPMIMTVGRLWDEAKNVAAVERAAAHLPWPVVIAGEDRREASTQANTVRLGKVTEEEVARWLSRTSIYTLPARYEPFGLSILEAALCECALVLGDIPSLRENWDGAAEFVSPRDPDELEEAALWLIEDADRRQRLAKAAHRRARHFSPNKAAGQYLAAYRQLIEQHHTVWQKQTLSTDIACAS